MPSRPFLLPPTPNPHLLSPTPTPTPHPSHPHQLHHLLLLSITLSSTLLLLLLSLYLLLALLRRRRRRLLNPTTLLLPFSPPRPLLLPLTPFPHRTLRIATDSFHPSRLLGRGASASVFRGILPSGKSVAIKVPSPTPAPSPSPLNELSLLSSLPPNPSVISLLGYSRPRRRNRSLLLVYEFMPNGSLQEALFRDRRPVLPWPVRREIILDIARGLAFLHSLDPPVLHCDIKPSNVLLAHDFRAKLADFGLARLASPPPPPPEFNFGRMRENPIAAMDEDELVPVSPAATDEHWWWKQDLVHSGELSSRDYVREWIGSQISDDVRTPEPENNKHCGSSGGSGTKKSIKAKEWWKEEYFTEMNKKSKSAKGLHWFQKRSSSNVEASGTKRKKRSKSTGSDMWSGDLFSRELTSTTTSTRGAIGYVAPEHGLCGQLTEKSDIYSFGVLILVIVSGRRPLHVLPSPMRLEQANLVSWCRQLAASRNVLDVMDESLKGCFDREQASLCINLGLLCLQRSPELRPDGASIVKILTGEMELPVVPFDLSPSPNSKSFSRSRRKASKVAE